MAKSIGIDLGTTNSVVAVKRVGTVVLKNSEGELLTPSCVTAAKDGSWVVGRDALEWMKQDPENTVVAVKRLMGRSMKDPEVNKAIAGGRLRYNIAQHSRGTDNSIAITLRGAEHTPEEVSAAILAKLRQDAERELDDEVTHAVITVPAYFNDKQKHATRTAAALAGLRVRRLLPEPTAAAISFGVDAVHGDDAKTVLVFDLGGGTFDLSVLTISGGQFIEQGKGGDMWLGGEEVDAAIADYALAQTAREAGIHDIQRLIAEQEKATRDRFLSELKMAAERAKIRLSSEDEAYVEVLGLLVDEDGDRLDVDVTLSRSCFQQLIAGVVDRAVDLCRVLLEDLHFTPDLIDEVLLVGGSSQIPAIAEAVSGVFGRDKVRVHERPMLAVAEGAAILSHRLADTYECPTCGREVGRDDAACGGCGFDLQQFTIDTGVADIVHTAAHDYALLLENGERHLLVERNTPLPFAHSETLKLVSADQYLAHMKFFNRVGADEECIGDLWLGLPWSDDRPPPDQKPPHVELSVSVDESNLVEVTAALVEKPEVSVSRTLSRGKADEKLFMDLEALIADANRAQHSHYVTMDLEHRALMAVSDIHHAVDKDTGEVDAARVERAARQLDKARRLATEDIVSLPVIYYAETALDYYGHLVSGPVKKTIRDRVRLLRQADEAGTYEETKAAVEHLREALDGLEMAGLMMTLEKAANICEETAPGRAPKFRRAIDDIDARLEKGHVNTALEALKEILPEAMEVIESAKKTAGVVHTGIRL